MRILFDQGTPAPLRQALAGHQVSTAHERGWSGLQNGDLLQAAEAQFDGLITTDQSLEHQQNLSKLRLAILVLPTTSWPEIRKNLGAIASAVDALRPGDFVKLDFT